MPILNIGDIVTINPPFQEYFPGTYPIIALAQAADTYTIDIRNDGVGSDFDITYITKV